MQLQPSWSIEFLSLGGSSYQGEAEYWIINNDDKMGTSVKYLSSCRFRSIKNQKLENDL